MLEGLPWAQLGAAGAGWTLAAVAVWFVLTGRLVPRSTLDDQRRATETWRATAEANAARADRLSEPNALLLRQVLSALPPASQPAPQPGAPRPEPAPAVPEAAS